MSTHKCPHCQAPLTDAQATMCEPCRALFHPETVKRPLPQASPQLASSQPMPASPPPTFPSPMSEGTPSAALASALRPGSKPKSRRDLLYTGLAALIVIGLYLSYQLILNKELGPITMAAQYQSLSGSALMNAIAADICDFSQREGNRHPFRVDLVTLTGRDLQVNLIQEDDPVTEGTVSVRTMFEHLEHDMGRRIRVHISVFYPDPHTGELQLVSHASRR